MTQPSGLRQPAGTVDLLSSPVFLSEDSGLAFSVPAPLVGCNIQWKGTGGSSRRRVDAIALDADQSVSICASTAALSCGFKAAQKTGSGRVHRFIYLTITHIPAADCARPAAAVSRLGPLWGILLFQDQHGAPMRWPVHSPKVWLTVASCAQQQTCTTSWIVSSASCGYAHQ